MKRQDILELRKRFKKEEATFTRLCGCFINSEKDVLLKFNETFLNLDEDDYFKYLDTAKKVLYGTIGNNILELNFPNTDDAYNKQLSLIELKKSELKNDNLLDDFYKSVIDNYDYDKNYLILLFHDVYDIISKTTDNMKLDESEEVFEYVLCAICPVTLSPPGLSYFEEENKIGSRFRDWVVNPPINGFVYPAFIDRSPDVNSIMYYTKNTRDIHPELMEKTLGCPPKETSALKQEKFQSIVKDSINDDEEKVDKFYIEIQENLNNMVEDYKERYGDLNTEPIRLSKNELQEILVESGIPEESTAEIEKFYKYGFDDDLPLAESLIDKKALKAGEQLKKERTLENQVEFLKDKLEKLNPENYEDYDIVLQVKSEKVDEIRSKIIDGQEYLLVPVNDNEKTSIEEISVSQSV